MSLSSRLNVHHRDAVGDHLKADKKYTFSFTDLKSVWCRETCFYLLNPLSNSSLPLHLHWWEQDWLRISMMRQTEYLWHAKKTSHVFTYAVVSSKICGRLKLLEIMSTFGIICFIWLFVFFKTKVEIQWEATVVLVGHNSSKKSLNCYLSS